MVDEAGGPLTENVGAEESCFSTDLLENTSPPNTGSEENAFPKRDRALESLAAVKEDVGCILWSRSN